MAEFYLRFLLKRAGITDIAAESAGVFAVQGMSASRETTELLRALGIDCSAHRSRPLTRELAESADLILVMERFQGDEALRCAPDTAGRVHLLRAWGAAPGSVPGDPNIPDPVGKPLEVYETCFATIQEPVDRVAAALIGGLR